LGLLSNENLTSKKITNGNGVNDAFDPTPLRVLHLSAFEGKADIA